MLLKVVSSTSRLHREECVSAVLPPYMFERPKFMMKNTRSYIEHSLMPVQISQPLV